MADSSGPTDADLDDILDSALKDFEENELDAERADHTAQQQETDNMAEKMAKVMEDMSDPNHAKTLEETFKALSTGSGKMPDLAHFLDTEAVNAGPSHQASGGAGAGRSGGSGGASAADDGAGEDSEDSDADLEEGVAKTLQNLANATQEMEGMETNQAEQMGEEMMMEMMKEFEKMGEKEDFQEVIDGMMKQLLSKEVMYEPMKQICERFPAWLAEKEAVLSKDDYERHGRQYQFFQKIVAVYDTEPDNFPRLMELMQDMQECGQPPSEIIKDLAPGLEFGPDGMPIMPNMGAGMMPAPGSVPSVPGMPTGPNGEQCTIC